jgi:hypothetical protein
MKGIFKILICVWFISPLILHWLIYYLQFYVPLKNFSLILRRHHYRWRAAKFRPMLGAHGLWAGRDLYRVTPAVTRDLGFSGLIRRTAPFSRLLRHTRGCGGSILTRILTGLWEKHIQSIYLYFHKNLLVESCIHFLSMNISNKIVYLPWGFSGNKIFLLFTKGR